MDFIAYYRVSTAKQGRSGLGLDAQKKVVRDFANTRGNILNEYVEIESGSKSDRPELEKAIDDAKSNRAALVVARLDRFSRSVSFISGLMEKGIGFQVAEMPNASDFQLHIHAACAQEERRLISERTRAALQQAKERGVILGKNGKVLAKKNKRLAKQFAKSLKPLISEMLNDGLSYSGISRELNKQGTKSFRNKKFYPSTVQNIVGLIGGRWINNS
jgi:DNA invertase Pin-like site-specific DNA recombinase